MTGTDLGEVNLDEFDQLRVGLEIFFKEGSPHIVADTSSSIKFPQSLIPAVSKNGFSNPKKALDYLRSLNRAPNEFPFVAAIVLDNKGTPVVLSLQPHGGPQIRRVIVTNN